MLVMIVDDDPDDRFLIMEALRRHALGCELVEASSGEDALVQLRELVSRGAAPALILSDTNMREFGGLELFRRLRGELGLRGVATVLMSSTAQGPDAEAAKAAGVPLLRKPMLEAEYEGFSRTLKDLLSRAV